MPGGQSDRIGADGPAITLIRRAARAIRLGRIMAAPDRAEPVALRRARADARQERREIDRFLALADELLALPRVGSNAMRRIANADWSWRPSLWRLPLPAPGLAAPGAAETLDDETSLFHDCASREISVRQERNRRDTDLAPFGITVEAFRFDGSFLSLAVKLPQTAAAGLTRRHIVRVDADVEMERPVRVTVRLNVRHGPNTAEVIAELPPGSGARSVEFDLAHAGINERVIERAWLDIILVAPDLNRVSMRDLVIARRPRAEL